MKQQMKQLGRQGMWKEALEQLEREDSKGVHPVSPSSLRKQRALLVADHDTERRAKQNLLMLLLLLHFGRSTLGLSCNVIEGDSRNQVVCS